MNMKVLLKKFGITAYKSFTAFIKIVLKQTVNKFWSHRSKVNKCMHLIANDKRQLMICRKNTLIILRTRNNFWSQWVYKYFNTSRRVRCITKNVSSFASQNSKLDKHEWSLSEKHPAGALMKSLRDLLNLRQYLLKQNTSVLLAKRQRKHD